MLKTNIEISQIICMTNRKSKAGKVLLSLICITIHPKSVAPKAIFNVDELLLHVKRKIIIDATINNLNNLKIICILFVF